ncbi:MAG TPA: hypothetical protein VFA94_13715, partial [Acidimicrobiales bacterium]|nr:hypothetical protein [Acidimicrobiales bacterium]
MPIVRTAEGWGLVGADGRAGRRLKHPLAEVLAGAPLEGGEALDPDAPLLAPVDEQEVWAAG